MVSAEIATEVPNRSPADDLESFRYACWDHVDPSRTNTYAPTVAPELSVSRPFAPSAPGSCEQFLGSRRGVKDPGVSHPATKDHVLIRA